MTNDDWADTVAALPPGAPGCMGAPVEGPGRLAGRINVLCRTCLRRRLRQQADRIMPTPNIALGNGTYYCEARIGD